MRISGGEAKGRQLFLPKGYPVRPTADVVKEALFSILRSVSDCSFLDLFAGSGSVGIEALSRGAAKVVFVERNKVLAHAVADNLGRCGFADRADVLAADVKTGIRILTEKQAVFDLVFADPPYDTGFIALTLQSLAGSSILAREGTVILQHSVREEAQGAEDMRFVLTDQRRYGDTLLSFLKITT